MKLPALVIALGSLCIPGMANAGDALAGQFDIQGRIVGVAIDEEDCVYISEVALFGHVESHPVRGRGRSRSRALCNNEVIGSRYTGVADVLIRVAEGGSGRKRGYRFKARAIAFSRPLINRISGLVFDAWDYQLAGSFVAMEEEVADCLFLVDCDEPQPPTEPGRPAPEPKPKPKPDDDCWATPVLGMEEEAADC